MSRIFVGILMAAVLLTASGCDRIYGLLHKPGGEEREVLGNYTFNLYSPKVEELQKLLKLLGYNIGRADGRFGPGTREAVAKFQAEEGLEVTRFVDKATWAHLQAYASSPFVHNGQLSGKAIQLALRKAGFDPGKADGQMGKNTRDAVKAFQLAQGLDPDGHVGLRTIKALWEYLPDPPARPQSAKPAGAKASTTGTRPDRK
ncbi:MAG: peptidoglycan-binding protein [Candidatus Omnitrophica bacterium]|nr:peptidoglycan-binding protein [Candidatus Omnitrophota bacterium]